MSWLYPVSPTPIGPGGGMCTCYNPRFDLDQFGRIFLPDFAHFRVNVLDNLGHKILHFGHYGNMDSQDLSYAWPAYVAVTDKAVYVSDMINRRIVRAAIGYAATGTVSVPTTGIALAINVKANEVQVFPNPFNSTLVLRYSVPAGNGTVSLSIWDINGKKLRTLVNQKQPAGQKQVRWNGKDDVGRDLSNGVYFLKAECSGTTIIRKMLLIR